MPLWDPERARKRKLQIDSQRIDRELNAMEARQERLKHGAMLAWVAAGLTVPRLITVAAYRRTELGYTMTLSAVLLLSAFYMSETANSWQPPRWTRWIANAYAVAATVVFIVQLVKR